MVLAVLSSFHAILNKRDPRAAVAWAGLILMVPFGGCLFYWMFGVNRVARRAGKLRRRRVSLEKRAPSMICTHEELCAALPPENLHLSTLSRVGEKLTGRSLLEGN